MKDGLKKLLRHFNLAVVTARHAGVPYLDHVPQNSFEAVLLRCFPKLAGLNFIQVGANDGLRFDPINAFVGRYGWRGVLVEPVPANFRHLQATYAGRSQLTLLQAAVDVQAGERPIYHLKEKLPTPAPDWVWGLASFDRQHLLKFIRAYNWPPDVIETTLVPTITWNSIWQQLPGEHCDVLVIDTEGHDIALLRSAGLAQRRPRMVHFEHDHVAPAERLAFYSELIALGYELATDAGDTTAWLPPAQLPGPIS